MSFGKCQRINCLFLKSFFFKLLNRLRNTRAPVSVPQMRGGAKNMDEKTKNIGAWDVRTLNN